VTDTVTLPTFTVDEEVQILFDSKGQETVLYSINGNQVSAADFAAYVGPSSFATSTVINLGN
jgi:hypothetical protein